MEHGMKKMDKGGKGMVKMEKGMPMEKCEMGGEMGFGKDKGKGK